jgi:hypothetical protein
MYISIIKLIKLYNMSHLNENGITDAQQDEINDVSIRITNNLIKLGLVPDCTDTDDETELEVQDSIREVLIDELKKKRKIELVSTTNFYILTYGGNQYQVSVSDESHIGLEVVSLDGGEVTAEVVEVAKDSIGYTED